MKRANEAGPRALGQLLAVTTLGVALLAGAAAEVQAASAAGEVEGAIRATLERYVEAVNAGDLEAVVPLYAGDRSFFWIEDGAVRYRSQEEVAEAYAGLGDAFDSFRIELHDMRVVPLAADAASVGVLFWQEMTTKSGTRIELEGAILATMVERDGAWKFLAGHTSTRRPPQPAAEEE